MMSRQRDIDQRQADALIELVASIRLDWDKAGIRKSLSEAAPRASGSYPRLIFAAVKAATRASNVTPAVIALDGDHWKDAAAATPDVDPYPVRFCDSCSRSHVVPGPCPPFEDKPLAQADPDTHASLAAAAKAAIRPVRRFDALSRPLEEGMTP